MKIILDIASRVRRVYKDEEYLEYIEKRGKDFVKTAHRMYVSHMMDQNESAGVMAAHSLGEPGTQMNMRTFHYAGVANVNVTQGLPRLIEIVDARRIPATPSMVIPLVNEIDGGPVDEGVARHIASEIEITTLLDVAEIQTDVTSMELIIVPDARKISEKGITPEDIKERLNKIKAVRGNVEIDPVKKINIIARADEPSFKKLQLMYDTVKGTKIKGIDGITRAVLSKKNDGGWSIITEGSNLKEVLKVRGVDSEHVMTNSILEVADVLGIEA
ncbi:MAG: DNA-directed RNA polymerase subunit A'', partial [Candidatus Methanomethylophilaceae archaeon]|nr:DNA-directed RNA polymerase subunit A'' [Candidatus Methanomethylophilaceae archaeon]